jgi:hypothetical protein
MRKVLSISVLTAACALIGVSGSSAQDYYRQEQDRKRAYYERQDLRRDYRERAQDERRFRLDRYKERQAERRGDWRAADYYARRENRDAAAIRRENRDIREDRRELRRDEYRCARDGTRC